MTVLQALEFKLIRANLNFDFRQLSQIDYQSATVTLGSPLEYSNDDEKVVWFQDTTCLENLE